MLKPGVAASEPGGVGTETVVQCIFNVEDRIKKYGNAILEMQWSEPSQHAIVIILLFIQLQKWKIMRI